VISLESFAAGLQSISKPHLATGDSSRRIGPLPFLFVKISQAELGNTHGVSLQRFPNELAAESDLSIIIPDGLWRIRLATGVFCQSESDMSAGMAFMRTVWNFGM